MGYYWHKSEIKKGKIDDKGYYKTEIDSENWTGRREEEKVKEENNENKTCKEKYTEDTNDKTKKEIDRKYCKERESH